MSWELTEQLFEKQLNRFRFLFFSSPCLLSFPTSLSHFLFFPCISPSISLYCVCTINKRLSWDLYLLIIHTHHTHCFRREIYTYTCIHVFVFFSIFFYCCLESNNVPLWQINCLSGHQVLFNLINCILLRSRQWKKWSR